MLRNSYTCFCLGHAGRTPARDLVPEAQPVLLLRQTHYGARRRVACDHEQGVQGAQELQREPGLVIVTVTPEPGRW